MTEANPFDQFDSEAAPAFSAGSVRPSLTDRFIANYENATLSASPEGALGEYLRETDRKSAQGFENPREAARQSIRERDFAYQQMPWSDTALDWIAATGGTLSGAVSTPSSWLYAPIKFFGAGAQAARPVLTRAVEQGAGAAASNVAQDVATQGVRMAADVQDKFDPLQTGIAAGAGFAIGGGVGAITARGAETPTAARTADNAVPETPTRNVFDQFDNDNAPADVAVARMAPTESPPRVADQSPVAPRTEVAPPEPRAIEPRMDEPVPEFQARATPADDLGSDEVQNAIRSMPLANPRDQAGVANPTGEAVPRLEDIGRLLQEAAPEGTAFRQGRLSNSNALGQFGTQTGVIRLRNVADFPTFTHEVAHAIEDSIKAPLAALKNQHSAELMQWAPASGYKPNQLLSEGFAEYLRELVTRPAIAQQRAPNFTAAFQTLMQQQAPDSYAKLMEAQGLYGRWLAAPSNDVTIGDIVSTSGRGPIDRFRETMQREGGFAAAIGSYYRGFYTATVDQLHPINVAVDRLLDVHYRNRGIARSLNAAENAYKLARLSTHASNAGFRDLMEGVVPYRGTAPVGPSLSSSIATAMAGTDLPFDRAVAQFGDYLASRRMLVEYQRFHSGEIPNPPGKFTEGDYRQTIADYEARFPQFRQAADQAYLFQQNLLQKKFESGFLTQEQFDAFSAMKDYAPLQRDMRDFGDEVGTKTGDPASKAGGTGSRSIVNRFRGSQRAVINPLESIMRDSIELSNLIARNEVFKSLEDMARRAGPGGGEIIERIPANQMTATQVNVREAIESAARDMNVHPRDAQALADLADSTLGDNATALIFRPGEINEKGEPIVYAWRNGKRQPLRLADGDFGRDLYQAMTLIGAEQSNVLTDTLALGAQALRMGVTTEPSFIFANLIRDMMSAWVLEGVAPGTTQARGLVHALRGDEVSSQYARAGGMTGGAGAAALEKARFERDLSSLRERGFLAEHLTSLGGLVRLTEFSESATRLGLFQTAFERARGNGLSEHDALIEAAFTARDLIDFGRSGSRMLHARKIVTFMNAAIQGLDKAVRELTADGSLVRALAPYLNHTAGRPLSDADRAQLGKSAKVWARMVVGLGGAGLALSAVYRDDPEYEEIGQYFRDKNWAVKVPDWVGSGLQATGLTTAKTSKGLWLMIPKPFELAIFSNIFERSFEAAYKNDPLAWQRMRSGVAELLMPPAESQMLKTAYELRTGYDLFRNRPIVPENLAKRSPSEQWNEYTSEFSKFVGNKLGVSPMSVDHAIMGFAGTWGRTALSASNVGRTNRAETGPEDWWITSRFIKDVNRGTVSSRKFWDTVAQGKGEMARLATDYKAALDDKTYRTASDILAGNDDQAVSYALLEAHMTASEKRVHPLNRARDAIGVLGNVRRELIDDKVEWRDADRTTRLSPASKAEVEDVLSRLSAIEARNSLIWSGVKGWSGVKEVIPSAPVWAELRDASPQIYDEVRSRYGEKKVMGEAVATIWPKAQARLLQDRNEADLSDLAGEAQADYDVAAGKKPKRDRRAVGR